MDHNGRLFYAKLEEGNGSLGDRKIVNTEKDSRPTRYEEAR